jgi:hypothetical protein
MYDFDEESLRNDPIGKHRSAGQYNIKMGNKEIE